ncbi:unnamed protein product [Rhodiola kirilowii]
MAEPQQPPATTPTPPLDHIHSANTLIHALNLVSRNLPLPPDLLHSVSSIYWDGERIGGGEVDGSGSEVAASEDEEDSGLLQTLDDALTRQLLNDISGSKLAEMKAKRLQSRFKHRLSELERLPTSRGDELQTKCLLELYGLKLAELQSKVRSEVSSEFWLRRHCAHPEKKLFDWGIMRLQRPLYGVGDAFSLEADDQFRKKRDAERLSRLEEEEKHRWETRKRKFFAEILNGVREFQLQIQAVLKRRKQRNDGIQAWHGKQRQRATRAEKLRFQALKADDQEAYLRMVEESKNERLAMLVEKTNTVLGSIGDAVRRQKGVDTSNISALLEETDPLNLTGSETHTDFPSEGADAKDPGSFVKVGDILEGQRQYNSVIHSIQEQVVEQPAMLEGGELRSYQLEGLQWMVSLFNNNLNGILADEMGLGKTIQTISLIAYLMENKDVTGPHLIVAPKAVLPNWVNEFAAWAPSIMAVLYDGRLDERKVLRDELSGEGKFNVLITHYDLIMRDKAFLKKINWHYMIVDEGHRLKNHECALAKTVGGYTIQRRLLLTGTPIQNNLQELWALLNFILPTIFNSVQNFEEWFNAPFADRGDVSLSDEEEFLIINRLHQVIRPFILRRTKDQVEKFLPAKSQVILKCDMSAWQKVYYQQITQEGRVGLDNGSGRSKSLQNLSMQLRKCCNHPYLFVGDYNIWQKREIVRASGKFELLDRLLPKLRAAGHRVLLFSQMTRLMDILEVYLRLHDFKYIRLDGSTKTEERGTLLKKFNAPDSPFFMFLLSTRAGGLGLNLQTADTVIIFDSDWNPQMDQQAEDRAHRIGQKKEVKVFVLISVGSIEEVILERAKQKMGIDEKVIQAGLFNPSSTAQDRKELLKEIMRKGSSSLGRDVPSEREINRLAARSDAEFRMFEEMDEARRQEEMYESRLMEEHEVHDWVYAASQKKESKGSFTDGVMGKRKRKTVTYADTLSDIQWMKAVENGEDMDNLSARGKRKSNILFESNDWENDNIKEEKSEPMNEILSVASETSEDTFSQSHTPKRLKSDNVFYGNSQYQNSEESEWNRNKSNSLSWKPHKKKRSFIISNSSTGSKVQNSSKGNDWS